MFKADANMSLNNVQGDRRIDTVDAQIITGAALGVLDEVGLDKMSMRLVAARLGVQVGGLYYYVADKAALLRLMANELCDQMLSEFDARPAATFRSALAPSRLATTPPWAAAAVGLCGSVRDVLKRHRDAARVLAVSPLNGSLSALALMERLIALLEPGITAESVNVAADTLMAYVTGFVLQEQSGVLGSFPISLEELAARFPRVFRPVSTDDDQNFIDAAAAIISGFGDLAARPPDI
jgi:TetR/AcrR family tetracycline transcriptional repressor